MKKYIALLLLIFLFISFVGCSEKADSKKRILSVWVLSHDYADYIKWTVDNYCDDKEWTADISVVDSFNLQQLIEKESEKGNAPDIIMLPPENIEEMALNGTLKPLSESGFNITKSDYYDFAVNAGTINDKLYAMCWHASPGIFAYRRSVANAYLGTDEPHEIETLINNWESLLGVSQLIKAASIGESYMLVGIEDITRTYFGGNFTNIDKNALEGYLNLTNSLYNEGYIYGADMWSQAWIEGFNDSKSIFGYYLSGIAVDSVLCEVSDESYGDWGVAVPFSPYTWGGAYLSICSTSDNEADAVEFIELLTVDEPVMTASSLYSGIFTANKNVNRIVSSDPQFELKILNGQNYFEVLINAAENIDSNSVPTSDDAVIISLLNTCAQNYISGEYEIASAIDSFYKSMDSFVG